MDGTQRGEADLLAVRFPFRAKMRDMGYVLADDDLFPEEPRLIDVVLVEVKARKACTVNPKLMDRARSSSS